MAGSLERKAQVRGVGVLQMGYMGATAGLLGAIIVGGLFAVIMVISMAGSSGRGGGAAGALGALLGIGLVCLMYPLFGFIGGCIYGLLYNLAGLITGGLEIEVK